ncbi:MAG: hypothetical protein WBK76_00615 [Candidatus Saccharimonadales bacterium]
MADQPSGLNGPNVLERVHQSVTKMVNRLDSINGLTPADPLSDETMDSFDKAYKSLKKIQHHYSLEEAWTQPPITLMQDSGRIAGLLAIISETAAYFVSVAANSEDFRLVYEAYLRAQYYREQHQEKELGDSNKRTRFTDQEIKSLARERLAEFMSKHSWKVTGAEMIHKCVHSSELLCQRLKDCAIMTSALEPRLMG